MNILTRLFARKPKTRSFYEFLVVADLCRDKEALITEVQGIEKPKFIFGRETPATLNELTIGQLLELQSADKNAIYAKCCSVVMGATEEEVMKEDAQNVLGLANWCASEMKRIGELFERCVLPYTKEQKAAGFDKLKFGVFAIIDNYAKRMGYHDHSEVEKTPWVRVWKCMDMDAQVERCKRRAQEQARMRMKV